MPRDRAGALNALIQLHGHEDISLSSIARRWGVSTSRASHVVTEITGMSWRELLTTHRLRLACHLLRTTDLALPVVAQRCGSGDRVSFGRLFRKAYGTPPGQWRRQQDS